MVFEIALHFLPSAPLLVMLFVLTSVFLGQHRAFLLEHYPVYVNLLILVLPEKTLVRVLVIIGIAVKTAQI
jgi:hypothetical protein